jgi:Tfp pilus assembly protein PilF
MNRYMGLAILVASAFSFSGTLPGYADEDAPANPVASATENASQIAPEAREHFNAAVNYRAKGAIDQAANEYKAALAADNKFDTAWAGLGTIYNQQKKYDLAIQAYQNALTIKPKNPSSLNALGMALSKAGRSQEAMAKFREAITYDPNYRSAYYNLAGVLKASGKDDDAKKVLQAIPASASIARPANAHPVIAK